MRQYLDSIPEYSETPIWINEIGLHVGFDGWTFGPSGELVPVGAYRWDKMSDYLIAVLDWIEANAASNNIQKWMFLKVID